MSNAIELAARLTQRQRQALDISGEGRKAATEQGFPREVRTPWSPYNGLGESTWPMHKATGS